jgi:hypothetical protein
LDSPVQLATQIRFHLESLAETNAHHPFEQLCLGLTRRRIVSNVMPATGPVSAGGDAGRDAESFWTVLANELPGTSLFTALATDDAVVIAVTAQRDDVPTKIRVDLAKICGQGEPVDRVVYFTVMPVDTAKRHRLIKHANDQHSVKLTIWDAQAIATEIASPDLFYLAVDFLHLPSSMTPERDDEQAELPAWYLEERKRWREQLASSGSMGEVVDLREGLRFSSLNIEARGDLPEWLNFARKVRDAAADDFSVLNRIDYETVIATGFGLDTLKPVDEILRGYFQRLAMNPPDSGVLVDAITLLRLVQATQPRGETSIGAAETEQWADALELAIENQLNEAPGANTKVSLLAAAVILAHGPTGLDEETLERIDPTAGPKMSEIYLELSAAKREGTPLPAAPDRADLRNLELGMRCLVELVDLLPSAPMAPLDQLTTMFDITAPALVDHPDYRTVQQALDAATAARSGKAAAGDRAQNRAVGLLQAGRPLDALGEIHAAKVNWLQGDEAEGAARMMLLAAEVYYDLHLPMAAKQYAMSAASVAKASEDPELSALIARGFILAATYEHKAGQWLSATRTFRIGIWAQAQLAGDPWSFERYPYFQNMLIDQCFILRTAATLRPDLLPIVEDVVASTQLDQLVAPMLASVAHVAPMDENEVADAADKGGLGRPFSDVGPFREYSWAALENTWTVRAPNDRHHVLAAERFAAAAQITLADLACEDLLIIPGEVSIDVEVCDEPVDAYEMFTPSSERSQPESRHMVRLTRTGVLTVDDEQHEVAGAVLQVILTQSLLAQKDFVEVMEQTYDRGLPHMLTCVRPYDELVDVHKDDFYDELRSMDEALIAPTRPRRPAPAVALSAEERSLPEHAAAYDRQEMLRVIGERYEVLPAPIRFTVQRLADDGAFMTLVASLREQGWKDWHLLIAVANITVNERAVRRGLNMTTSIAREDIQRFHALMQEQETAEEEPTPTSLFSEGAMWFHLGNASAAAVSRWGLEVRMSLLEPQAFLSVLGQRFNFWEDDVDHDPVFAD